MKPLQDFCINFYTEFPYKKPNVFLHDNFRGYFKKKC